MVHVFRGRGARCLHGCHPTPAGCDLEGAVTPGTLALGVFSAASQVLILSGLWYNTGDTICERHCVWRSEVLILSCLKRYYRFTEDSCLTQLNFVRSQL